MDWFAEAVLTISGCYLAIHLASLRIDRKHQARLRNVDWEIRRLQENGRQLEKILTSIKEETCEEDKKAEPEKSNEEGGGMYEALPEEANP